MPGRLRLASSIDEEALIDAAIEAGCDGDVELQASSPPNASRLSSNRRPLAPQEPDADGRGDDAKVACVVMTDAPELGAVQARG